jgi:NADPH:quinone reductase-like Zn-dependent oxidoreductase
MPSHALNKQMMPGLTAWQGLFEHGRLHAGQSVLVHGAAGVVGSMATQLAREVFRRGIKAPSDDKGLQTIYRFVYFSLAII